MVKIICKAALRMFSLLLLTLTVFTVNSTCIMGLGQEVEPESLSRFKKNK